MGSKWFSVYLFDFEPHKLSVAGRRLYSAARMPHDLFRMFDECISDTFEQKRKRKSISICYEV